jgi:hypothetical protein
MCPTVWPAWIDLSLHAGGIGDAQATHGSIVGHGRPLPCGARMCCICTQRRRAKRRGLDHDGHRSIGPAPGTRRRHRDVAPLPAQLYHPWFVPASQYDGTVDKKRFRACCPQATSLASIAWRKKRTHHLEPHTATCIILQILFLREIHLSILVSIKLFLDIRWDFLCS